MEMVKKDSKGYMICLPVRNVPKVVVTNHHVLLIKKGGVDEVLAHLDPDSGYLHDGVGCHS